MQKSISEHSVSRSFLFIIMASRIYTKINKKKGPKGPFSLPPPIHQTFQPNEYRLNPSLLGVTSRILTPFDRRDAMTDVTDDFEAKPHRSTICCAVAGRLLIRFISFWVAVVVVAMIKNLLLKMKGVPLP